MPFDLSVPWAVAVVVVAAALPDIITTVVPAVNGFPELAVSNALGGVLGQTAFLAVADLTYRRANLEHAAASVPKHGPGHGAHRAARRGPGAVLRTGRERPRHPPGQCRAGRRVRVQPPGA